MRHFVSRYASEANKSITTIAAEAMDALANWNWPGNVRELQNLIQRWVILTESTVLRVPQPQFIELLRWTRRLLALEQHPGCRTENGAPANSDCHRRVEDPPLCGRSGSLCHSLLLFLIVVLRL